jgi:arginyl-tRNA--protein-N-Asp/Glu arginylyltransferase
VDVVEEVGHHVVDAEGRCNDAVHYQIFLRYREKREEKREKQRQSREGNKRMMGTRESKKKRNKVNQTKQGRTRVVDFTWLVTIVYTPSPRTFSTAATRS